MKSTEIIESHLSMNKMQQLTTYLTTVEHSPIGDSSQQVFTGGKSISLHVRKNAPRRFPREITHKSDQLAFSSLCNNTFSFWNDQTTAAYSLRTNWDQKYQIPSIRKHALRMSGVCCCRDRRGIQDSRKQMAMFTRHSTDVWILSLLLLNLIAMELEVFTYFFRC